MTRRQHRSLERHLIFGIPALAAAALLIGMGIGLMFVPAIPGSSIPLLALGLGAFAFGLGEINSYVRARDARARRRNNSIPRPHLSR